MLGFMLGSAVGFASGFILGVDYGRRHNEPWKDLRDTAEEFVVWTKRTFAGGPTAPVPPVTVGPITVQTSAGPLSVDPLPPTV